NSILPLPLPLDCGADDGLRIEPQASWERPLRPTPPPKSIGGFPAAACSCKDIRTRRPPSTHTSLLQPPSLTAPTPCRRLSSDATPREAPARSSASYAGQVKPNPPSYGS